MDQPSPDLFIDAAFGYLKTAAIQAAVAIDLFTVIAQEDGDLDRVAARTGASKRGVRILCDYLTGQGFLIKNDAAYSLTPSSELFLTTTSPAWIGSIVHFLCSPEMTTLFLDDPASFVRNGGSVGLGNLAPNHPAWVKFARAMVPFMRPTAGALADEVARLPTPPKRVLDIALDMGCSGSLLRNQFLRPRSQLWTGKPSFRSRLRTPEPQGFRSGIEQFRAAPLIRSGAAISTSCC